MRRPQSGLGLTGKMDKNSGIKIIRESAAEAEKVRRVLIGNLSGEIFEMAQALAAILKNGGKLLLAGNGGSAADASHFATELVVRLTAEFDRPALPAVALTSDGALLTAAGNDFGFDRIFSRQVEALATDRDGLILISTSGNSANLIEAAKVARTKNVPVFSILGRDGGKLPEFSEKALIVPAQSVQRIQEEHAFIIHVLVELMEREIF